MKTSRITALLVPALGLLCTAAARADAPADNSAAIDQVVIAKLAATDGTRSKILAHLDLTERFNTRSQWTLVVAQQLEADATSRNGLGDPQPAVSVCWVQGLVPDCSDARFTRQYRGHGVVLPAGERAFYQLTTSRIVASRPGGQHPLLELQACTLPAGNGSCGKSTFLYRYDEASDSFRTAFFAFTGSNNNQETRFIENGPLRGQVVTVTPTPDAPFGYFVELYRPDADVQHYSRVLNYRSRTRYNDGNPLPVIDSEMPELLKLEGFWKKGRASPVPQGRRATG